MISMFRLVTVKSMTSPRTTIPRRLGVFFAVTAGVLALAVVPVSAQTYSDGGDGSTDQSEDTNTTPTTTPGSQTPGATDPGTSGGTNNDDVVAQADDDGALAFTGSDSMSLALIGAGIVTAGGLLVVSSRRKVELPA